ncbi:branched-chain amino acid ABC transporter permease/ATP-binding protein [Frankia gtarii]|uniref:branched-chain amino acid ABC transporter permease/ATP-binding protein n=1 Tax=Frankia gtarii TaxID=2950102 RepID=UPI0021C127D4|nr:branched-chain amino acid ABC transporter permease/ATP-binding protein [Frankia gtarii]
MLPFLIAGLTTGSVYGLAGVGLVLTYKTSGIFNFAHGAVATVSAYLFYSLHVQAGLPWVPAAAICILGAGPVLGLAFEQGARRMAATALSTRVAGTVGVLLVVQAGAVLIYGDTRPRKVPVFLPDAGFHLGSTTVTADRIIVFAVGIVATAALYAYFSLARTGVAMRAVVDDPALLDTTGTNPVAVRRWAWMIGIGFAATSGVLVAQYVNLDATALTFLVVAAFGAAALGWFTSLPATYVGGLVIGIIASLATKYFDSGLLAGLSNALPFLVLFAVLLTAPRRRLTERLRAVPRSGVAWTTPWRLQSAGGVAVVALLCFVPSFAGIHLVAFSEFLAYAILFLSLGLLVRTSGQVSLCHVTFMAIGVCAFSQLHVEKGWPWAAALVVAGLVAVPIGALLAIPAIRLSGLYLALSTFGFGILVQYMFYSQGYMFGSLGIGVSVPTPRWAAVGLDGSDRGYYYLVLILAAAAALAMVALNRSRLGRLLRALADSPIGLATSGTAVNTTRVLVFCLSAFLAAVAGVLDAAAVGQVNGDSYLPITSLVYFVLVVISVGGAPWYAVAGAAGLTLVPSYVDSADTSNWLQVAFGVFAILYAVTAARTREPHPAVRRALDRLGGRGARGAGSAGGARERGTAVSAPGSSRERAQAPPAELEIRDVRVAFGGLVAVDGVTLRAATGHITGLIGPNGAGKTTTFNVCSGLLRPQRGQVLLDGRSIIRRSASTRARLGLGRTFQQMELFDNLTVWDNVVLGAEGRRAGPNALRHLASTPRISRDIHAAADSAVRTCGLGDLTGQVAGSLSTGQRRLVELARCLAGQPRLLLLDEPSSGLDRAETRHFGQILRRVVDEHGVGILLVEHDMSLVTAICDHVYVLDFGRPVFDGVPAEVMASPVVRVAYLGETDPLEPAAADAARPHSAGLTAGGE